MRSIAISVLASAAFSVLASTANAQAQNDDWRRYCSETPLPEGIAGTPRYDDLFRYLAETCPDVALSLSDRATGSISPQAPARNTPSRGNGDDVNFMDLVLADDETPDVAPGATFEEPSAVVVEPASEPTDGTGDSQGEGGAPGKPASPRPEVTAR